MPSSEGSKDNPSGASEDGEGDPASSVTVEDASAGTGAQGLVIDPPAASAAGAVGEIDQEALLQRQIQGTALGRFTRGRTRTREDLLEPAPGRKLAFGIHGGLKRAIAPVGVDDEGEESRMEVLGFAMIGVRLSLNGFVEGVAAGRNIGVDRATGAWGEGVGDGDVDPPFR